MKKKKFLIIFIFYFYHHKMSFIYLYLLIDLINSPPILTIAMIDTNNVIGLPSKDLGIEIYSIIIITN